MPASRPVNDQFVPPPPPPPPPDPATAAPTTPAPSSFARPDWRDGPSASTRALQSVVVSSAAAGALWRYGVDSIGAALWLVVVAATVAFAPARRDRLRYVALVAAIVFAACLALRSSPWLVPLNAAAALGLVAFAAVLPADRRILQRPAYVIARFFGLFRLGQACFFVVRSIDARVSTRNRSRSRAIASGVLISIPLLFVIGGLLAAGDVVFSAALETITVGDGAVTTGWYLVGGATVAAMLMLATSRSWDEPGEPSRELGSLEASIVAGALALLYAAFAITQAVATFGGVDQVLETAGLTRAEYAREGFFQLLYAAGFTLAALLVLDRLRRRDHDRSFRWFAVISASLTLLVVAVSIDRLLVYIDDFGWTMLRLSTVLFAAWVGVLFVGLAVRFAGLGVLERWYPVFVAVTGLVGLLGVNLADPEAFVARENLADPTAVDVDYLIQLSDDATPTIVDALDRIDDPSARAILLAEVCEVDDEPVLGNVARMRAADAVEGRC